MATKAQVMRITGIVYPILIALIILFSITHWLGLFGRFIIFLSSIAILISASIFTKMWGPGLVYHLEDWDKPENQYIPEGYDKEKWNILLDTHFHTKYSDGLLNIEESIKWHKGMGFNAFFVTDHDNINGLADIKRLQKKYQDEIIIMPGIEIASENCHMNILGIEEWDQTLVQGNSTEERIRNIVKIAHEKGAVVTINHYPWSTGGEIPRYSPKLHPTREQAYEWGIDFIEASNWDDDVDTIDLISYNFCNQRDGIAPVAGTDVHKPEKDMLYAWTLLKTDEFTPEAVMQELINHRTDVLFKPNGIPYPTKHKEHVIYKIFKPFYQIGELFLSYHKGAAIKNVDWMGIMIWVLYIIGFFGLLEIAYLILF